MISIELKGSSLNEDAIGRILSSARRLSLLPNLFFWFRLEPEDNGFKLARMVKQQEPDIHIGVVYKDALSTDLVPILKPEVTPINMNANHHLLFLCVKLMVQRLCFIW